MRYDEHGESGPGKVPAQPMTVRRIASATPRRGREADRCCAHRTNLWAEEAPPERLEQRGVSGRVEAMGWRGGVGVAEQVVRREHAVDVDRGLLGTGHERHVRPDD